MAKYLVIVESPTKIKTLRKFLGKDYRFESSVGHIRDLPKKKFGIDLENDFTPEYETLPEKKEVIAKLKKAAKEVDEVFLCPDPDREGEAIAWHIASLLPKKTRIKRATFNAITKAAVVDALAHPREIDHHLVDAQQARRLLDRMVGYKISPILHRKIQRSRDGFLSAGRVQSVALKLVVDREKEIEAFTPIEYWNLSALLEPQSEKKNFKASLHSVDGLRIEKEPQEGKKSFIINNEKTAKEIEERLKSASYSVSKVEKKEKKRRPVPPFITSTLQQEASRHFGFASKRTMGIAQSLYEGVDFGKEGAEGLITYMRTDSIRVAGEAFTPARAFIQKTYGKNYLPDAPIQYSSKKTAQDAHEAIRPTNFEHTPESIKSFLTSDQFKLYQLIWRRFIASQMLPAIYDTVQCDIDTDQKLTLRATGSIIKFDGYLRAYKEKQDEELEEDKETLLPTSLKPGSKLNLLETRAEQAFTRPPPRYSEASLVKELEKCGIGRPSTYATIMNKIQSKDYTTKEKLYLKPTELGRIIAQMLEENFTMIMDIGFTAKMEEELDTIAEGKADWKKFLGRFWKAFAPTIKEAEEKAHVPKLETDLICPECSAKVLKIWARNKYFYGCSKYPDCKYTAPIEAVDFNKDDYAEDFNWEQSCPKCQSEMLLRHGRFGPFLGCTKYPDCNGIVNIPKKGEPKLEDLPPCPAIGCDGNITQRRTRFGKPFFSCTNYPDCDVIVNDPQELKKKYPNHPKTPYKKKAGKGGGAKRKLTLSKALSDLVDEKELTRGEITKKIWEYIKSHKLQDPDNKQMIIPDEKLAKVFGNKEPLHMMKLAGIISKNIE
ncbi:MAG: type I DNA topoisomerase [Simkaniaceae bacterium]